ncbi:MULTISPECIES: DNA methyltransferase [unclassified Fusibacter]|uniref:DNA methyltransferase n=1 Tax=unclassified Fusibacter TaxID=2624464 RepID=UPI0010126E9C|nr:MULTISPECIES: DNA methyltransferase [unclassified Fusibacter]MCK8058415.1 site-specific DNA-methyltransferase [Fusibacter sp. A2]NPE22817.1 DNA methylase [Fusibacter sp. A1]RXV60371.1 DNA methylase [Fusibacter sp. A1]
MKLTKEDIDKVRHFEGFPIAKDEDIIALSKPPYYTACPNPFIEDFINEYGKVYDEATDDYQKEPFAADVSEGKNDPIYMAHSYHTKVPYKAIMRYILHYTSPDDIVLDGFCGTGMTGVAAQMCDMPDPDFKAIIEKENPNVEWGSRKAILNDLSPMATFIAHNYNSPFELDEFKNEFESIIEDVENKYGYLYRTKHSENDESFSQVEIEEESEQYGNINYTVWSDVFICSHCGKDVVFWDSAVDRTKNKIISEFKCLSCGVELKKNTCVRSKEMIVDVKGEVIQLAKQNPVLINYTHNGKRYEKTPDADDLKLIQQLDYQQTNDWFPTSRMCDGIESRRNDISGVTHAHLFMTKRNLKIFAYIFGHKKLNLSKVVFTSVMMNCTKLYRFRLNGKGGSVSGTLYIPSLFQENNIIESAKRKLKDFSIRKNLNTTIIGCGSTTQLPISDNTIDYIFTDPPFGSNLNYSELSFIWESWLKVYTNNQTEAVMNRVQKKNLLEYQNIMTNCFEEYYRVLKPNRWMTVEFHNSQNAVWNAIQEGLQRAGFIVADVRILDKQQDSFKQVNTTGAVKQDLVISAYKPQDSFKRDFISHAGSEDTSWDFVRQHLEKLPVVLVRVGKIELVAERQSFVLFDRMVAYHIMNGISVPLDASDFYRGLDEKFLKRDNMYFLTNQVNEYDSARIINDIEPIQFSLMVTDEKTAIAWLYQQLDNPQTYADIQPKFMQEVRSVAKYEKMPELSILLEDTFLQSDDGKWYVPDVTKAGDVMKLRDKKLLKEFEDYVGTKGKLKLFRSEAIRAGFAKLWKEKNYKLIVDIAERLPEKVIQEDDKLLMYYDISLGRI